MVGDAVVKPFPRRRELHHAARRERKEGDDSGRQDARATWFWVASSTKFYIIMQTPSP